MKKLILTKLEEVEDPRHPNNIPIGNIKELEFKDNDSLVSLTPVIGQRFGTWWYSTSPVTEIINENTFSTLNSVYEWEIIEIKA